MAHTLIGTFIGIAFGAVWQDSSLTNTGVTLNTQLMSAISKAAAAKDELLDLEYMNDANSLQSPLKSYGAASVAYLQSVSKKYDPTAVFQKLQNSGFLLSKL